MSFVKWCPTQQALPKSAILTDIVSVDRSSEPFSSEAGLELPKSMPDTSRVSESLLNVKPTEIDSGIGVSAYAVFSLCDCISSGSALMPRDSSIDLPGPGEAEMPTVPHITISTPDDDDFIKNWRNFTCVVF